LITFVPPDPKRFSQRGFNSPEILATHLAQKLNLPVLALFKKKNHTKAQAGMSKIERLQNLDDVFELDVGADKIDLNKIKYLWLVDDVIASGTTVEKLIQVLYKSFPGIEVTVIVLARNLDG
jgi:predicted amidophosphoribosyltransferase